MSLRREQEIGDAMADAKIFRITSMNSHHRLLLKSSEHTALKSLRSRPFWLSAKPCNGFRLSWRDNGLFERPNFVLYRLLYPLEQGRSDQK